MSGEAEDEKMSFEDWVVYYFMWWLPNFIFFGLAVILGVMVFETGAARWLAQVLLGRITLVPVFAQPFVIVLVVAALHLLFSSNTVTGAIIMPILIALAQDLGLEIWTVAAPAAFTSSHAFILVTESPTNVLPYSAGYFSIRDMARVGIVMTIGAAFCVALSIMIVGMAAG